MNILCLLGLHKYKKGHIIRKNGSWIIYTCMREGCKKRKGEASTWTGEKPKFPKRLKEE